MAKYVINVILKLTNKRHQKTDILRSGSPLGISPCIVMLLKDRKSASLSSLFMKAANVNKNNYFLAHSAYMMFLRQKVQ